MVVFVAVKVQLVYGYFWLLESSSEGANSQPMTYDEFSAFRKAKQHERQGHFKNAGSRKKKAATVSVSDDVR